MRIYPNFKENILLKFLAGLYALVWIVTAIQPVYPSDWMLENILVVLFVLLVVITYNKFPLSDLSYICIAVFMALHAIGAHYTYAETPVGFWMQEWFGFQRNHFDRVVHFSFGLLMAYPVREVFLRVAHTRGFFAYYLPLDVTLAFSAVYEIIEMVVAVMVNPQAGDAYLGTQGDIWDAQKDMGLAALGALLCMVMTAVIRTIRKKPHVPEYPQNPS
jgi:putative membrane protein